MNLAERLNIDGYNAKERYVVTCLTNKYKDVIENKTYTVGYSHLGKTGDHWIALTGESGATRTYKAKYFGVGEYYKLHMIDTSFQDMDI